MNYEAKIRTESCKKSKKGNKNTTCFLMFAFRTMLFVDVRSQCWTKKHPVLLLGWVFAHTELLSELTRIFGIVEGPWHNVYSETPHRPTLFAASKYFFEEKLMTMAQYAAEKYMIHVYCIYASYAASCRSEIEACAHGLQITYKAPALQRSALPSQRDSN